jgi:hypothetical protein
MAKKRLTFDVEESLHSEIKAKAAERKVSLGALCSSLLVIGMENDVGIEKKEPVDPSMYPNIGLEELREEALRLGKERLDGWDILVRKINAQIVRRYRVS